MDTYLHKVAQKFSDKQTSEMGYRTDFENLLETIFKKDEKYAIHHDAKSVEGNKPDFVVLKNLVPLLYIEAKDIGISLDKTEKSNQMSRYYGYANLILTDYLEFRFYRNGEKYCEPIKIAEYDIHFRTIKTIPENFERLSKMLLEFTLSHKEPIKKGIHLAKIMGQKSQRIRDNVREMLVSKSESFNDVIKMRDTIKETLLSSLEDDSFADMYAQTLIYGLFAARYHDKSLDSFSRQEARDLVPKTNPFLRSFFDHIAGTNFPNRLKYIVDEMCEVFSHADVNKLMHDFYKKQTLFGEITETKDPVIHFYEDFLKEYDPAKKMEMGVFYTPKPVVKFIVRAVDEILKTEFGLAKGLADNSKIKKEFEEFNEKNKKIKIEKEFHKVQVLDVATGTGTFLNEVVENIYSNFKDTQQGQWPSYVERDLLPRIHGFELMMASYTIAHLKLGMTLEDTGAKELKERLGIYLTNTLEEPVEYKNQGTLFGLMDSIAEESKSASRVKSEFPIMCVIGNPPYSGESMNKGYTYNDVYKVEIGGKEKLKERNSKWINDDYVKFIRFAESLIEKNGEGVMAMITAHGYIDNPTFRGMRWHLRNTFDKIYIIDLHGNGRKKEVDIDGGKDENVFDIMTGVSIILGVKKVNNNSNKKLARVLHYDLFGKRNNKFEYLHKNNLQSMGWSELSENCDVWKLESVGKEEYEKGFSVAEIFPVNSVGVVTSNDSILINVDKEILVNNVRDFYKIEPDRNFVQKINYRPLETRYIYFDKKIVERSRSKVMENFISKSFKNADENSFVPKNIGLVFKLGNQEENSVAAMVTDSIIDFRSWSRPGMQGGDYVAPAYIISIDNKLGSNLMSGWVTSNLNEKFTSLLYKSKIFDEKEIVNPVSIIDYIYAVLHSPTYREKYKEFLKIDFPRVPFPKSREVFWELVKFGEKLRNLHLMTAEAVNNFDTSFPEAGEGIVEKTKYENKKVFINSKQYFGNVPEVAWNFYIGGYQPAQKWLKDRKGRVLTNEDINHYQKIIKVLVETDKIMKEIDDVKFM